jgi:pimeloyl-ACP methyl ester carboxylesterase
VPLQIDAALGAPLEQLDLDLPDAAPHLEHRCALNSGLLEEPNHPARSLVEISGSRLVVLPDTGHACNIEAPDEFNGAVRDFLHEDCS